MKVFLVQPDVLWENRSGNHAKVGELLESQIIPPGSLIVLPEMFATGFSMNLAATIEPPDSETESFLQDLAIKHQSTVIGGLVRSGQLGKGRNVAVAMDPAGKPLARYCKLHPFSLGQEDQHYEKGENVVFFETGGFVVSPFICYDLRFPEVFRTAAGRGAELLVVIAQWPIKRVQHWVTLLQARAIENQAYVVGVNRCGKDPTLEYPGRSLIVDPLGNIIADAGENEGVVSAVLDHSKVSEWRRDFPALRDTRKDLAS